MVKSVIEKKFSASWKLILVLLLIFQVVLLLLIKFTAWPEVILWPYLLGKGWLPYRDIAIAHNPLMLVNLAIFYKIFGLGLTQLKIFTWVTILLTSGLIFLITENLWGKKEAVFSVVFFALWQIFFEGNGLWFDLYMGLLALASFYFVKKRDYFWTGIFWALAFFAKQTAFWFLFPLFISLVRSKKVKKYVLDFLKGGFVIAIIFSSIAWQLGVINNYFFWAYDFGITKLPLAKGQIATPGIGVFVKALLPFSVGVLLFTKRFEKFMDLGFWMFAGMLGAYPRFELFHFQPAVPYLAMFLGVVGVNYKKLTAFSKNILILYTIAAVFLYFGFLKGNLGDKTRFFEPSFYKVADYVKEHTKPNEKIYVLNYWDHLYAVTDTLPATRPWVPHLAWYMQLPGVQEKMVEDLKESWPQVVIMGKFTDTGLSSYRPQRLTIFLSENYEVVDEVGGVNVLRLR